MRIADVCAFYAPQGGGVRTYIDRKLAVGPGLGHDITIIAPGDCDKIEVRGPGARIIWLKSPRLPFDTNYRYFADPARLHAALDAARPDVVECSSPWRSASVVADWRGSAPRSLIMHADPLSAYAYRWFEGIASRSVIDRQFDWYWRHLRRLDQSFDVIVSAGNSLTARMREGGVRRMVTIPMGIEARLFSPGRRDALLREQLLRQCGIEASATLLLAIGRHAPEKRWPMIIDAVASAGNSTPVGLVLVGDGRDRAKLLRRVGDNPHIRLLPPMRDRVGLARLLASGDALIHGCEAETFCMVAAEASASGLPLIVPDTGGAADIAQQTAGILYSSGDARAAAQAIKSFVASKRNKSQMPLPTPRLIDDHFSDLFDLYRDLLVAQRRAA